MTRMNTTGNHKGSESANVVQGAMEISESDEGDEYFAMLEAYAQTRSLDEDECKSKSFLDSVAEEGQDNDVNEEEYFKNVERVNVELSEFGIKAEDDPIWFQLDLQLQGYGNIIVRKQ